MVPPTVPDLLLPSRDGDVGATEVGHVVRGLPEVCPVVAEETAVMMMSCSVAVETGPQVECESDRVMSERRWRILLMSAAISDVCRTSFW